MRKCWKCFQSLPHDHYIPEEGKCYYCRQGDAQATRQRKINFRLGLPDPGPFPYVAWAAYLKKIKYRCECCKKKTKPAIDHVFPASKGGQFNMENLQALCGSCNSKKRNKTHDYRQAGQPQFKAAEETAGKEMNCSILSNGWGSYPEIPEDSAFVYHA